VQSILRLAGGALLLYLAWSAYRQWRRDGARSATQVARAPRTLFEAALVNLLNPNPYLGWTLILGPIVVAAWQENPSSGVAVVVAFYATMVTTLAVLIFVFGGARFLGARFERSLVFVSVWILAGLGVYQLVKGVQYLGAG
jgi:threonine/homoserine/homoserine lactone efflux protein